MSDKSGNNAPTFREVINIHMNLDGLPQGKKETLHEAVQRFLEWAKAVVDDKQTQEDKEGGEKQWQT